VIGVLLLLTLVLNGEGASSHPLSPALVIYYANETVPATLYSENYGALFTLLNQVGGVIGRNAITNLTNDSTSYEDLVDRDFRSLMQMSTIHRFDLVVFTNALALHRRYIFHGHDGLIRQLPFRAENSKSRVTLYFPLAIKTNFEHAIISALRDSSNNREVILIINSHGTRHFAIIPRVATDFTSDTEHNLKTALAQHDGNPLAAKSATLQGISKAEFWATLKKITDKKSIRISLVAFDACESGITTWSDFRKVSGNVELIAHTGFGSSFPGQIDYTRLGTENVSDKGTTDEFVKLFGGQGFWISTKFTLGLWPSLTMVASIPWVVYIIPMLVWLLTWLLPWVRARWLLAYGSSEQHGRLADHQRPKPSDETSDRLGSWAGIASGAADGPVWVDLASCLPRTEWRVWAHPRRCRTLRRRSPY
jgi:hypothetical protein